MKYYQEITLIHSTDIHFFELWSKLYAQLHLALVNQAKTVYGENAKKSDIGFGFPEYKRFEKHNRSFALLGSKIRVFAKTEAELQQLDLNSVCERLLDYVHIRRIDTVDDKPTAYVIAKRIRQNRNNDRLTRAYANKHGLSFEEAKQARIERFSEQHNVSLEASAQHYDNPKLQPTAYVTIKSTSSGHEFPLEIEQLVMDEPASGLFSTYGLSSTATVPHW